MTTASKTSKKVLPFILATLVALPHIALASAQITEVMYDPPGTNAGHQWVEVTNMGSDSLNLAGYKLFEGGTNHGLSIVSGTTTLAAGESAILSSNPGSFSTDFPTYSGTVFKAAFSLLSKTGETIILKDASLTAVDTVTYDPSAGAAGDGNSLHRSGNTFAVGAPNPGSIAPTTLLVASTETTGTSAKTTSESSVPTKGMTSKSTNSKIPATSQPATSVSTYSGDNKNGSAAQTAAAAPLLSQINLPQGPWAYLLGGFGIVLIGVSAFWYLGLQAKASKRNVLSSDEFEIE